MPTPAKAATAVPTPANPTVATPFNAPTALPDMELIAFHAVSAPLFNAPAIREATELATPDRPENTPLAADPTLRK